MIQTEEETRKEVKGIGSSEMKWRKDHFDQQVNFFSDFENDINNYVAAVEEFSKEETIFGRSIKKRFEGLNKEEVPEEMLRLYDAVGTAFSAFSLQRKEAAKVLSDTLKFAIQFQSKENEKAEKTYLEYQKTIQSFSSAQKKLKSIQSGLEKAEASTKKQTSVKSKNKMKEKELEKEQTLEKEFSKFAKMQRFATYIEEKSKKEFDYHLERGNNDFVYSLMKVLKKYHDFHNEGTDRFRRILKNFNGEERIKKFKPASVVKEIVIEQVSPDFLPQNEKRIFGVDVEEVMKRPTEKGLIPKYAEMMINFIEKHNAHPGIFRLPGSKENVEYLKKDMDNQKLNDLSEQEKKVNDVASLIKEYFRDLPDSFAPLTLFNPIEQMKTDQEKIDYLKIAVKKLTPANEQLFYELFKMFHFIHLKREINKMGASNISVCWSMNIFPVPEGSNPIEVMKMTQGSGKICTFLIEHFPDIFPTPPIVKKFKKKRFIMTDEEILEMNEKILGKTTIDIPLFHPKEVEEDAFEGFTVLENHTIKNTCAITQVMPLDKQYIVIGDEEGYVTIHKLDAFGFEDKKTNAPLLLKAGQKNILHLERLEKGTFYSTSEDGMFNVWFVGKKLPLCNMCPFDGQSIEHSLIAKKSKTILLASGTQLMALSSKNYNTLIQYTNCVDSKITSITEHRNGLVYVCTENDGILYEFDPSDVKTLQPKSRISIRSSNTSKEQQQQLQNHEKIVCFYPFEHRKHCSGIAFCKEQNMLYFEDIQKQPIPSVLSTERSSPASFFCEINRRKEVYMVTFNAASKEEDNDEICVAIGPSGIIDSITLKGRKVLGMKKWKSKEKKEAKWFYFWDNQNSFHIYSGLKCVKSFENAHTKRINNVSAFLSSSYFVTCSDDKTCRIWER